MSSVRLIVAADIFGVTPELISAAQAIDSNAMFVSPYASDDITFKSEQDAYHYFTRHTSVENYAEQLGNSLCKFNTDALVVGFSVGAAAAWLTASRIDEEQALRFDLFYGGQIRHHLSVQPKYPISLFSPSMESHFDINEVNEALNQKAGVEVQPTLFMHGFMNPRSVNYSSLAAKRYWLVIEKHLKAM